MTPPKDRQAAFNRTCINSNCYRFVSDEDRESANKIGLPFAISPFEIDCEKRIEP